MPVKELRAYLFIYVFIIVVVIICRKSAGMLLVCFF